MKKNYLIFLALLPCLMNAQMVIDTDWKTEINNIFEYLDKSKVSSGHLLDYAMEFTDITAYDGVVRDTNYVDLNVVGNIYKTLYMAKTSTDTTHTPQYQKFAYDIAQHVYQKNLMEKNNIVLTGLLFEYQHLDTLALGQNRIRVINNRYYDKYTNGVWQNPYKIKRTMAVATSTNQSSSKTLKFMLPSNLFLSNISGQIATIEMNFDNGQGWQTITLDQYITISFSQNRIHEFTTRINLSNGQQMLSRTKFKIDDPDMYAVPIKSTMISAPNKIRISEGLPFTSSYIGADLTIRRMSDGVITRPLIIVEGFDTGHITDPADEDGDTGINSLRDEIDFAGTNLENLLFNNPQYDIIYVDWIKGTASMEDNSRILKQVIEWVNNEKTGPEPNVILGQSMGGVISRYTLAKWEQEDPNFNPANPENTTPHDVRLFIAHDSPMQGANTPLSIQHFTRHVKLQYVQTPLALATGEVLLPIAFNLAESVSDFINWFGANTSVDPYVSPLANLGIQDTPAARELNYWSLETWNHTQTQDYYDDWQSELSSVGYPLASRNVAISNGNECAEDHGFNPGDLLFKIDDVDNPDFFGDLLNMIGVPLLNVTRPLDFGLAIVGALPGASKWQYNFDFYATPTLGSQDRLYRGRIRYEKRLLWIGPRIKYDLTNRTFNSPASALPYDSYAGGYFDVNPYKCFNVNGQIECDFDFAIDLPSQVPPIQIEHRQYGFIPTLSALDIVKTNGNNPDPIDYLKTTSGGMIQDANLVSNFDNFIVDFQPNTRNNAPGNNPNNTFNSNNSHLSFQVRNGNWLAEELEAQNPTDFPVLEDCSMLCEVETWEISGPDTFCDVATFTLPSGVEDYNWNFPGVVRVPNPLQPNVVEVQGLNDGYQTISATINLQECGGFTRQISKTIYVGKPLPGGNIQELGEGFTSLGIYPSNTYCDDVAFRINNIPHFEQVDEIEWELVSGNSNWDGQFRNGMRVPEVVFFPDCNETVTFRVRYGNECGFSDWTDFTVDLDVCDNDCNNSPQAGSIISNNFVISPVPANDYLAIDMVPNPTWRFYTPDCSDGLSINSLNERVFDIGNTTNCPTYVSVQLYNFAGMPVLNIPSHPLGSAINVSGLLSGTYIMHVSHGGQLEVHQIPIQ